MDYQSWIDSFDGSVSLYSFDILPDGSYSEIPVENVLFTGESLDYYWNQ
ncbi:MAG: hypothetical protein K6A72_10620 [Lachnospiraceae bacterium]|nr:hypothetical protein [Lachnospiraceae bacterium]